MQDYSIERYAERVIAGAPGKYDAIEVQGVRSEQAGPGSYAYEVDNENPEAFSVYLHMKEGGVECVGDFTLRQHAIDYALELSKYYSWPIRDYTG